MTVLLALCRIKAKVRARVRARVRGRFRVRVGVRVRVRVRGRVRGVLPTTSHSIFHGWVGQIAIFRRCQPLD